MFLILIFRFATYTSGLNLGHKTKQNVEKQGTADNTENSLKWDQEWKKKSSGLVTFKIGLNEPSFKI